jgi:hypothetical protein
MNASGESGLCLVSRPDSKQPSLARGKSTVPASCEIGTVHFQISKALVAGTADVPSALSAKREQINWRGLVHDEKRVRAIGAVRTSRPRCQD